MTGFIPKEQLTAYERWELAAFDEAEQKKAAQDATGGETEPTEAVQLPTAEDIERIHNEAHATGYAAGYEEGQAQARAEAEHLAGLVSALEEQLHSLDQGVAEELLGVAVEIASQVLRQTLRVKPEAILPVVRDAIASMALHHGHPTLHLHPEDAALVRAQLGEHLSHNGWRMIEDDIIERGGCRIESGASEVDATLATRWRRVLEAIGTSGDWLEPRT